MLTITSKDNQYLKLARSLTKKKGRQASGCFLAEGIRLAEEAFKCGLDIRFALIAAGADGRIMALAELLDGQAIPVYSLEEGLFAGISATEHSQGIVLVAGMDMPKQGSCVGSCWAVGDAIADPGNLGAIIRSAYAAGVGTLVLSPGCADIFNPKVVRAAMGALFRLAIIRAESHEEAYALVRDRRIYITAADGCDIRGLAADLRQPHLWVLGCEAAGVSDFWRERADLSVSLPMQEGAESLNVAAAASVLFYQSFFAQDR